MQLKFLKYTITYFISRVSIISVRVYKINMLNYYYKSESDVVFRRVSLEHEQSTSIDYQNSNMCICNKKTNYMKSSLYE